MEQAQLTVQSDPTTSTEVIDRSISPKTSSNLKGDKTELNKELIDLEKFTSSFTPKRKKVVLSFVQKFEILDKLKAGMKVSDIAIEYNIGVTTVCDLRKNGQEKLLKYRKENIFNLARKTSKSSEFPLVDKALKLWVYQERSKHNMISDSTFTSKALEFYRILYPNSKKGFKASHGYIDKFCKRFEVTLRNEPTRLYAELTRLDAFLLEIQYNYTPEQIYNADECGLNYEYLPQVSQSMNKVTLMLCSNASAKHKLPLVLINKSPLDQNKLPIYFQTSPRGWMTREIFESWFHIEFVPKVRSHLASINQEEKAVLLLDNCPNHPMKLETEDGKIRCVYLPVDSINLMPMLQGPVSYLKRKYRTNYLRTACMDSDFLKNQTTKKAAYSLANLWEEMPENLLKTCWHKMKLNLNIMCNLEPIDMQELRNNFNHLNLNLDETEINSWLDIDFDNPGYGFLTDSEIIEQVVNEKEHSAADTSLTDELSVVDAESPILESSMSEANKVIDSSEAHKMCTRLMQWLEVQLDARPEDLVFVQRVKELASSSQANSKTHVEIETNTEINKEKIFNCCLDSGSGPLNDLNINSSNNTNEPVNNILSNTMSLISHSTESNLIKEAEALTLCFLNENGSITDTNGKIIVHGSTSM